MKRIVVALTVVAMAALPAACAGRPGPGRPGTPSDPPIAEAGRPSAADLEEQVRELKAMNRMLQARLEAMEEQAREKPIEIPSPVPRMIRDVPTDQAVWDDFRNVVWGVSLATRDDMDWDGVQGEGMYRYRRPDDLMAIGQAHLSAIYYLSCDDRFCGVVVETKGKANFDELKGECVQRFGPPKESGDMAGALRWQGRTSAGEAVTLTMGWDADQGKATCLIAYEPLFQSEVRPAARDIPVTGGF